MKLSKGKLTVYVVAVAFVSVFAARYFLQQFKGTRPQNVALARTLGDPKAPLHIVEYMDFQCAACKGGTKILKDYINKYPSQIYLEVKYYPISGIHWHAVKSALYAECAAQQNKFWAFSDLLFADQQVWSRLINAEKMFQDMAKEAHLNLGALQNCIEKEQTKAVILKEKLEGESRGVNSTPTYFINGKMVVGHNPLEKELISYFKEVK